MEVQYFKDYSPALDRDMECKVYGHAGRPVLFIPCQDGHYYDFENFGMIDYFADYLDNGDIMVISIDTIDKETWSDTWGDAWWRSRRHEAWINYITEEVCPFIYDMCNERNECDDTPGIIVFGCSLGATHAANLYFRRPDIFTGLLALSGIYSTDYGFGTYMDEVLYMNAPMVYLPNMPEDHEYMDMYQNGRAIICVGQGAWEQPQSTRDLQAITESKGIPVWYDYWGYDVNHDWDWWYKQVTYFLPQLLNEEW